MKGCCPFHGEKTPSFHVYDDHFHCFGCGAHGDVFTYVRQHQGVTFPDAVKMLAAQAGVEVPAPSREEATAGHERRRLREALEAAAVFYSEQIRMAESRPAQEYLVSRGVVRDDVEKFRIGYAPKGGGLAERLAAKGFTEDEMIAAGLVKKGTNGKPRDFFFDRIMFPIMDASGGVVSFGGRAMGDVAGPKYINGAETQVFKKSRHLFGMNLARPAAAAAKTLIIVEGYLDVIAMHRAGFQTVVAPLGTAVTPDHLETAWRVAPRLIGLFDGDKAGQAAAFKVCSLGLPKVTAGRFLSIGMLTGGDDPDSLIHKGEEGVTAVADAIAAAVPAEVFAIDTMVTEADLESAAGRGALRQAALDLARGVEDAVVGLEVARYTSRRLRDVLDPLPGGMAPVPADMGRVLVGLAIRDPDILTIREDIFRGLQMHEDVADLRDAICLWWTSSRPADKGVLARTLAAGGQMAFAKVCIATANQHVAVREECGLPTTAAAAFDDICTKVAVPVWQPRRAVCPKCNERFSPRPAD